MTRQRRPTTGTPDPEFAAAEPVEPAATIGGAAADNHAADERRAEERAAAAEERAAAAEERAAAAEERAAAAEDRAVVAEERAVAAEEHAAVAKQRAKEQRAAEEQREAKLREAEQRATAELRAKLVAPSLKWSMTGAEIDAALRIPLEAWNRDRVMDLVIRRVEALLAAEDDRQKVLDGKGLSILHGSGLLLTLSATIGGLIVKEITTITPAWYVWVVLWLVTVLAALRTVFAATNLLGTAEYKQPDIRAVLKQKYTTVETKAYDRYIASELATVYHLNAAENQKKTESVGKAQWWYRAAFVALLLQMLAMVAAIGAMKAGDDFGVLWRSVMPTHEEEERPEHGSDSETDDDADGETEGTGGLGDPGPLDTPPGGVTAHRMEYPSEDRKSRKTGR